MSTDAILNDIEDSEEISVMSFTIEADHPRNCDLLIQSIPGCRLRSAISGTKPVWDKKAKRWRVPLDQARHLASFPSTPGMRLKVSPDNFEYEISDPLHDNAELCDHITAFLKESSGVNAGSAEKINGVPPLKGKLDKHRMKTLCRELLGIVKANEAKVVGGKIPTIAEINDLPGKYLLNPGLRTATSQPTYEEDFEAWVDNLNRMGG